MDNLELAIQKFVRPFVDKAWIGDNDRDPISDQQCTKHQNMGVFYRTKECPQCWRELVANGIREFINYYPVVEEVRVEIAAQNRIAPAADTETIPEPLARELINHYPDKVKVNSDHLGTLAAELLAHERTAKNDYLNEKWRVEGKLRQANDELRDTRQRETEAVNAAGVLFAALKNVAGRVAEVKTWMGWKSMTELVIREVQQAVELTDIGRRAAENLSVYRECFVNAQQMFNTWGQNSEIARRSLLESVRRAEHLVDSLRLSLDTSHSV